VKPVVIETKNGEVLEAALTNEKGYKKSLERSALWTVNPETGRLLPHEPERPLDSIRDEGGWYRATVSGPEAAAARDGDTAVAAGPADAAGRDRERAGPTATAAAARGESGAGDAAAPRGDVLSRLYEVVRARQADMPEGSYTSYLFESGEEKIRKKTGEEAVELVLARDREDLIAESADLVYHLLVLLRAADIDVEEVLSELAGRLEG